MKQLVEGFRSVLSDHQADKPHERDGDEYKHSKSLYYMHNSKYTFGSAAESGVVGQTYLKSVDNPGHVDETPCPRCPDCGWGIDFGDGEEPQMKCSHCGSRKPASGSSNQMEET